MDILKYYFIILGFGCLMVKLKECIYGGVGGEGNVFFLEDVNL